MKPRVFCSLLCLILPLFLVQCKSKRPLEKVVLKDKTEWSGKVVEVDSVQLSFQVSKSERKVFQWRDIDQVKNIAQPTWLIGYQLGYGNAPYYSMFRGEAMESSGVGFQLKLGKTKNGNSVRYFHWAQQAGTPFAVRKWGWGFQRYLIGNNYSKKGIYAGMEWGLMKPHFNNGNQFYTEPFAGYDWQWSQRLRTFAKLGMQWNVLNQNPKVGASFQVGLHFLLQDWDRHYQVLNSQHKRYYP